MMSEIPEDIMRTAREIAYTVCPFDEPDEKASFRAAKWDSIARAIMAERERCAKIAETSGVYPELNIFSGGPEWYKHGKQIARTIRKPD